MFKLVRYFESTSFMPKEQKMCLFLDHLHSVSLSPLHLFETNISSPLFILFLYIFHFY